MFSALRNPCCSPKTKGRVANEKLKWQLHITNRLQVLRVWSGHYSSPGPRWRPRGPAPAHQQEESHEWNTELLLTDQASSPTFKRCVGHREAIGQHCFVHLLCLIRGDHLWEQQIVFSAEHVLTCSYPCVFRAPIRVLSVSIRPPQWQSTGDCFRGWESHRELPDHAS